ncbi:hypothetical protein [uncultured Sphingomonas sp.]|uniref:hypothetical protein n=1 Tax=uncultured Sphingomonas sp. TaxID=158754 RepID=UPI002624B1CD|nr:hypothetical protein [uncultured Sphingomonas sp.]
MTKLLISILVLAATGYTFFISWMVCFAFAFGGIDLTGAPIAGLVVFGLLALSPLPVCFYCFRRVQALQRGEHSRI